MFIALVVSVVVLIGLVVALVLGRGDLSVAMTPPTSSAGGNPLPVDREVQAADLERVRFDRTVRGYRMDQVDAVLDRLREELAERELELHDLRGRRRMEGHVPASLDPAPRLGPEAPDPR